MARRARRRWIRTLDPRRLPELLGERTVFVHLQKEGALEPFRGRRILEVGPKHGEDSKLLAGLDPSELVLLDLPEKSEAIRRWLPEVAARCPVQYVEGNLLYLDREQIRQLGVFDLVRCLGVVYHNVEQLRLLRRLFHLCAEGGLVVVESATTRNRRLAGLNVVELHWPDAYRAVPTMTHLPSRRALASWIEMAGFSDVEVLDVYSRELRWQRAVLTGRKLSSRAPYVSYVESGANPAYVAGDAS